MKCNWLFNEPENVAVFTTTEIISKEAPILFVYHDLDDGAWQFHHGVEMDINNARIVSLKYITEIDETINKLYDLPLGWIAVREDINQEFVRFKNEI